MKSYQMRKNRKAQIRMSETVAIIFIFFILIVLGIIFYYKFQQFSIKDQQEELLGARAMDTTLKTLFLPELTCTNAEAEAEDNCFDLMKLRHVNNTFEEYLTQYYFNIFSYSKISVKEVYPGNRNYLLYDKPKSDFTRREPTFFVIALKDEVQGKGTHYGFGYLKVEVYS